MGLVFVELEGGVRRESSRKSISGCCPQVNWLDSGDDGADSVSEGISIGMSKILGGDGVGGGTCSLCRRRFKDLLSLDMLSEWWGTFFVGVYVMIVQTWERWQSKSFCVKLRCILGVGYDFQGFFVDKGKGLRPLWWFRCWALRKAREMGGWWNLRSFSCDCVFFKTLWRFLFYFLYVEIKNRSNDLYLVFDMYM